MSKNIPSSRLLRVRSIASPFPIHATPVPQRPSCRTAKCATKVGTEPVLRVYPGDWGSWSLGKLCSGFIPEPRRLAALGANWAPAQGRSTVGGWRASNCAPGLTRSLGGWPHPVRTRLRHKAGVRKCGVVRPSCAPGLTRSQGGWPCPARTGLRHKAGVHCKLGSGTRPEHGGVSTPAPWA